MEAYLNCCYGNVWAELWDKINMEILNRLNCTNTHMQIQRTTNRHTHTKTCLVFENFQSEPGRYKRVLKPV